MISCLNNNHCKVEKHVGRCSILQCVYCDRINPSCGFYPIQLASCWISEGVYKVGQICWDCDREIRIKPRTPDSFTVSYSGKAS